MITINEIMSDFELMQVKALLKKKGFVLELGSDPRTYYPPLNDVLRTTLNYKDLELIVAPEFDEMTDWDMTNAIFRIKFRYSIFGKKEKLSNNDEKAICVYITKNLFPSLTAWYNPVKHGFDYNIDLAGFAMRIFIILNAIDKLPMVIKKLGGSNRRKRV